MLPCEDNIETSRRTTRISYVERSDRYRRLHPRDAHDCSTFTQCGDFNGGGNRSTSILADLVSSRSLLDSRPTELWRVILGYIVLYVYSWFNIYTLFAPHALVLCGLVGYGLFYLSVYLTLLIVKLDARLANFATRTIYSKSTPKELEPEDCVKRFSLASSTDSMGLPIVMMTCRSWVLLLYFSIAKVVVGAMSAATVFFAVVQPAMSLFSGGDGPFYSSSMTLHENPLLYVGIAASTWAFGVVGIVVVAALSVKLAVAVLGEWQLKQTQDGATELPAQTSPRAEFVELSVASPPAAVTPSL